MKIGENDFVKTFEIAIQLGAIMAILTMYYKRFFRGFDIYLKLAIAFIPSAVIGFLAYGIIKSVLFNPVIVAISLIIGGIILVFIDKHVEARSSEITEIEDIPVKNAFFIGLFQCLAMIPGVSRAAATIIGGVFNKFNKKQATEFSFLLAVPTMVAASGYDLLKTKAVFTEFEVGLLAAGLIIAFISAWFAVKIFLRIVERFGFVPFGYYRIIIGILYFLVFFRYSQF
jgi:undecaprenyl-diphosphatase